MDICVRLFYVCVFMCKYQPCDRLIPRPRSPTDCEKDQEAEKAVKVQQKAVDPEIDSNNNLVNLCSAGLLLHDGLLPSGLFLYPEDGGVIFLRNIG
jgi:hypothetical protein